MTTVGICQINFPGKPPNANNGKKATIVVKDDANTGFQSLPTALLAASSGDWPSSILTSNRSLITIASSTIIPRTITNAPIETELSVIPIGTNIIMLPKMEKGMPNAVQKAGLPPRK